MGTGGDGGWEVKPIDGGVNYQGVDFKKDFRFSRDVVVIDFADFNSGGFKGGSYNNGLTSSQFGLNSLFIHEYIGHGFPYSYVDPKRGKGTGGAVDRTNNWRKSNGYSSMLRLSYFKVKGVYFFGSEGTSLDGKKKDLINSLPYFKMDKKNPIVRVAIAKRVRLYRSKSLLCQMELILV